MVTPQTGSAYRFRYVGLTTQVAQTVEVSSGTVLRSFANDWHGERLLDWTGTGSDQHFYGTNLHHDVTWLASDTGAVTSTLRYDPWGNLATNYGSYLPAFRFQGSWYDPTVELSWVVARWYAPGLGRFVSEDSLLGEPAQPPSRNLYAYSGGGPVNAYDPNGRSAIENGSGGRAFTFRNKTRLVGKVVIALFIAAEKVCTFAVPAALDRPCLKGDARGWSGPVKMLGGLMPAPIDCNRARACITVDFDRNIVESPRVNRSCHWPDTWDCRPPLQVVRGIWFGSVSESNQIEVGNHTNFWEYMWGMCPDETVVVSWSFKNSLLRVSPTIDGQLEAWRCGDEVHLRFGVNRFPSIETFYFLDGRPRASWHRREDQGLLHGVLGLVDGFPVGFHKELVVNVQRH